MTDDELIKFGKQVCALSELRVSITRDPWKAPLQEARAGWRIRGLNGNVEDLVVREGTREQVFSSTISRGRNLSATRRPRERSSAS